MPTFEEQTVMVKSGAEYRESLRDGREVYYKGERIEDVVDHPLTGPGIDWNARLYDAQHDDETRDVLTYVREDGARVTTVWLIPRTPEDLVRKRLCTEYMAWQTFAMTGRQPDIIPWEHIGLISVLPTFRQHSPEFAENLLEYNKFAQDNNLHLANTIIEPQGARARSAKAGEDRSAVLRVVRRDSTGVWISGARAVGSVAAQANELMVGNIYYPHVRPDESIWFATPVNSEGLSFVARDSVSTPHASSYDHPVTARGFALDAPVLCDARLYSQTSRGTHWQILTRLACKAELLAGLAQLIVEALELGEIPVIRDQVSKVSQYAQVLRAGVIASEQLATPSEGDVLLPDRSMIAAVRAYGLENYPSIIQIVQELCGQGLVMRFSDRDFDHPTTGPKLEMYLGGEGMTARRRTLLMNLVWDVTASSAAGRSALLENLGGLPANILRQRLYNYYDRTPFIERIEQVVGERLRAG
jgi:4-hydroxyphenylacetate 3-monooxygenase